MKYPGRIIKLGENDAAIMKAVKERLNKLLALNADEKLDPSKPTFGPRTKQVVKLFQARNVDGDGNPLRQDGEIGSITWEILFGERTVTSATTTKNAFLSRVLQIAAGEEAKHVREVPKNSNKGPEVSEYLRRAGVPPGNSWCCAFVYWCFDEAAQAMGRANPMVKTAGCLDHWNRAAGKGAARIPAAQAKNDPSLIKPGMIFIMDHGGGLGHTGLIESRSGGLLTTVEGNTDATRGREGGGVYRLTRKIGEINKGFIDYTGL
jgi:hypothetical protein